MAVCVPSDGKAIAQFASRDPSLRSNGGPACRGFERAECGVLCGDSGVGAVLRPNYPMGLGKWAMAAKIACILPTDSPMMPAERSTKVERLASHHGAIALKVSAKSSKLIAVNKPLASPCMKKGSPGADFTAALRAGCETMGI
jgi:hypothetical protein